MRVTLIVGALAAAGVGLVAYWLEGRDDSKPQTPQTEFGFMQTAQAVQAKPIKPKGFTAAQVTRADEIHQENIDALNDLDAAMGIKRLKDEDGREVIVDVVPAFGASRMSRGVRHGEKVIWTKAVRKNGDPWTLVFSASGKPLTASNIEEATGFDDNPMVNEMTKQIRKKVAAANLGQDFDFETAKHFGYAKPLKLTKTECLPCHQGMKVGDTVGISVFTHAKPETKK